MGILQMGIFKNFVKNGHIANGHFFKLQKNGLNANGRIPKYANLNLLSLYKSQTSTVRKYPRKSISYNS